MSDQKKLLLIDLAHQPWADRWTALKNYCLKELQVSLEVKTEMVTVENLPSKFAEVLASDADLCHVSQPFSSQVLNCSRQLTKDAIQLGSFDALVRDGDHGWWPRACLEEAFIRVISKNVGQIGLGAHALVAGSNGYTKMTIGALVKLGFSQINLVEAAEIEASVMLDEMKKKYFKVGFNFVSLEQVTKLPGVHLLLLNTVPLSLESEILDELYFFNFLDRHGFVMDLNLPPADTPLVLEARQWGAQTLAADFFFAERDLLMIYKALGKNSLNLDSSVYRKELRALADLIPFEAAPFLKRFRERGT